MNISHPFISGCSLTSTAGRLDALKRSSDVTRAVVGMLDNDLAMENPSSRQGAIWIMAGVADVLDALSDSLSESAKD